MNLDAHFVIGTTHTVCQDYAACRKTTAALADGCSFVRGPDGKQIPTPTDVGSRLLVHTALNIDESGVHGFAYIARKACNIGGIIDLPSDCLAATLIRGRQVEQEIKIEICGDGVIAARVREDKSWFYFMYQYNAEPYYPIYIARGIKPFDVTYSRYHLTDESSELETCISQNAVSAHSFPLETYDFVIAISDGAFSFRKNGCALPFPQVASSLLDFRRLNGKFMQRHIPGVLRELANDNIQNSDDISMFGMYQE